MIPLFLTILCSTSIALILKYSDTKKNEPIVLLSGNYLVAAVISFVIIQVNVTEIPGTTTIIFSSALGLLFIISFFLFAVAVGKAGTALATISSRLSVVVPITFSIIIFNESPSLYQFAGFAFTAVTILFFSLSVKEGEELKQGFKKYLLLLLVLIGIGVNDFCMKIYKSLDIPAQEPWFVFLIFTSAFIYSILYISIRRIKISKHTFLMGMGMGVPNVFSTIFLLAALGQLEAIVVYPVINIGIILFTAVGAYAFWKEKLNIYGTVALLSGVIAILFLSMNN